MSNDDSETTTRREN